VRADVVVERVPIENDRHYDLGDRLIVTAIGLLLFSFAAIAIGYLIDWPESVFGDRWYDNERGSLAEWFGGLGAICAVLAATLQLRESSRQTRLLSQQLSTQLESKEGEIARLRSDAALKNWERQSAVAKRVVAYPGRVLCTKTNETSWHLFVSNRNDCAILEWKATCCYLDGKCLELSNVSYGALLPDGIANPQHPTLPLKWCIHDSSASTNPLALVEPNQAMTMELEFVDTVGCRWSWRTGFSNANGLTLMEPTEGMLP
jgi:hypothetical protein